MMTKLLMAFGCAALLLTGCSSPRGGTAQNNFNEPSGYNADVGTTPSPMVTPDMPSGMNPRDLRDPQSLTIPHPITSPRP